MARKKATQDLVGGIADTVVGAGRVAAAVATGGASEASIDKLSGIEKTLGTGSFTSKVDPNIKIKNINKGSIFGGGLKEDFIIPKNKWKDPYTT